MRTPPGRVLVLGCGSVAQATLPLLIDDLGLDPRTITVVDFVDTRDRIADSLRRGVRHELHRLTTANLDDTLCTHLGAGDLLLDLAWSIDTPTLLQWCRDHGVRYLNTSVEVWDPYDHSTHPLDRTLYVRHRAIRRMVEGWPDDRGPTAVVEHGANPGLVSHWARQALTEIATAMLRDGLAGSAVSEIEDAIAASDHARLAMLSGTKVIHIAERDTQVTAAPKRPGEFVNTWSVEGFFEEGIAPAEIGWGTHERRLPDDAFIHADDGPCNQICLARPGMATWVRSWVPSGEIRGMVIRHGEAFTMCEALTVRRGDAVEYRPTVHYAYLPSDSAVASVVELQMRGWELQPQQRILGDEIVDGRDELGVLLMGHPYGAWWTGSRLSIAEARAVLPGQNATTVQVAASIVAALGWMFDHPDAGVCVPDDLPWEPVLRAAAPYLGTLHSGPADWDPIGRRVDPFAGFSAPTGADSDPWQFTNLLVR
ncbi:MAG: saccharopine dehydrogenase C-terminal domain-containing protein [Ilumatobacteraceae bacterium]